MEIIYKNIGETGFVEVFVKIDDQEIKVDEIRYIFIQPQKESLEKEWIDKAQEKYQKNKRYEVMIQEYERAERVEILLKEKHPKKDTYVSVDKKEIWLYHKNGSVMKIVNVDEYIKGKQEE